MKWSDLFQDPDMVGRSEYRAIHEVVVDAVFEGSEPEGDDEIDEDKREQISGILEAFIEIAQDVQKVIKPVETNPP